MKVARHQIGNRPKRGSRHKRDLQKAKARRSRWEYAYQQAQREGVRWLLVGAIIGLTGVLLFLGWSRWS